MKKVILYPFLFSIFPVFFLYAHNIKETRLSQIFPSLVFSLIFCLFLWGISLWILKNKAKAGIVTSVFILIFFSFGHICDQLSYLSLGLGIGEIKHVFVIPVILGIWLVIFWFVFRSPRNFNAATGFLNIMALSLILINIINIAVFKINQLNVPNAAPGFLLNGRTVEKIKINNHTLPDVYYIVLDEYAGLESIEKLYNYDNRQFVSQLEKRGFYIAKKSKTKYSASEMSMASTLNMDYIKKGDEPYKMIQNSKVSRIFKQLGYKVFIFPMNSQAVFNNSDEVIEFSEMWVNDFNLAFLQTTMLSFLVDIIIEKRDYGQYYRNKILFIFERLSKLPEEKGRKFVYCHIMCPHYPFVFDKNGEETEPENFFNIQDKTYYLNQYIFINKKVIDLVDQLLARSKTPPVIVIQSDHGQRGAAPRNTTYRMAVGELWQDIFNAYYLPAFANKWLFESISPINTFRVIFNAYFQTHFPIIKD